MIVRLYDKMFTSPYVSKDELLDTDLLSAYYVMDNNFINNSYPVIDHTALTLETIDFPMHCLISYRDHKESSGSSVNTIEDYSHVKKLIDLNKHLTLTLSWGFGSVSVTNDELLAKEPPIQDYMFSRNIGVGFGMNITVIDDKPIINYDRNFIHHESLKETFNYFNVDEMISFDDFNKKYDGITKQEYLDLLKR